VFFAQLLEHVVEVQSLERGKGARAGFVNERPSVRYFSQATDKPGRYHYDPDTYDRVDIAAIYGAVRNFDTVAAEGGLLVSFDVTEDELNHMEGIVNETPEDNDEGEAEDEGPDSEALAQQQERDRREKALARDIDEANILPNDRRRTRFQSTSIFMDARAREAGFEVPYT
jgi:hypothetical protein